MSEQPYIDRLADTVILGHGKERIAALDELVARLKAAERRLATLGDTTIGLKAVEAVCDRVEAADERVAALEAALRDTLTEIDELGTAYTALRKKHEPPYIVYIPWSRPAVLAVLAGDGGEN